MKKLVFISLIFFVGCATQYTSTGALGGYSETQLDENVFTVYFGGNGFTSAKDASDMCLLRCAELCLENDYSYFIIIDQKSEIKKSYNTTPKRTNTRATYNSRSLNATTTTTGGQTYTISKPRNTNTIVLFKDKPDGEFSYNAEFLYNSLSKKYIKK